MIPKSQFLTMNIGMQALYSVGQREPVVYECVGARTCVHVCVCLHTQPVLEEASVPISLQEVLSLHPTDCNVTPTLQLGMPFPLKTILQKHNAAVRTDLSDKTWRYPTPSSFR